MEREGTLREVLEGLLGSWDTLIGGGDDLSGFLDEVGRPELPHDLLNEALFHFASSAPPAVAAHLAEFAASVSPLEADGAESVSPQSGLALLASVPPEIPDEIPYEIPDDGAMVLDGWGSDRPIDHHDDDVTDREDWFGDPDDDSSNDDIDGLDVSGGQFEHRSELSELDHELHTLDSALELEDGASGWDDDDDIDDDPAL